MATEKKTEKKELPKSIPTKPTTGEVKSHVLIKREDQGLTIRRFKAEKTKK